MSKPANDGPPVTPTADAAEHLALRAAPAWAVVWLVAVTACAAWWRVAPLLDEALVATVFLLGAAWWLINAGSRHARSPGPGAVMLAALGALLALRLLQVASPVDFWILRVAPLVLLPAVAVMVGGTGAVWPALPGWLALLLWVGCPSLDWLGRLDAGGGVSSLTARLTGWLLALIGHDTRVAGNSIWWENIRVDVLTPCTSLPLIQALVKTVVPGALLLRLTPRRTLWLALLIVPVSLMVSVVRCAVLVLAAPQPERFHFWHGPEGASVFTAVALGVIGWGMVAGARAPVWLAQPVPLSRAGGGRRFALAGMVMAAVIAWFGRPAVLSLSVPVAWSPPAGWVLQAHRQVTWPWETARTDKPLTQCDEWVVDTLAGRAHLLIGYAPVVLGGDPTPLLYLEGFDPRTVDSVELTVLPGFARPVAAWTGGTGRWWVTYVGGDGVARADPAGWAQWLHDQRWSRERWGQLLRGLGPLQDKRALWIAVSWPETGAGRPEAQAAAASLLEAGRTLAATLLSPGRGPSSRQP